MTTGATHAPASSAATAPIVNATANVPRRVGRCMPLEKREKSMLTTSNIASPSTTNSMAIAALNQGEALIVPKVPAVRITTSPSDAVDDGHRRAVGRAEQKAAPPGAGLRARADDRQVDRDHRQHAGRQVQRQPAEQDDDEDRQRSPAFEQSLLRDALLGVVDELQEVVSAPISAGCRQHGEVVQSRRNGSRVRGRGWRRRRRRHVEWRDLRPPAFRQPVEDVLRAGGG